MDNLIKRFVNKHGFITNPPALEKLLAEHEKEVRKKCREELLKTEMEKNAREYAANIVMGKK